MVVRKKNRSRLVVCALALSAAASFHRSSWDTCTQLIILATICTLIFANILKGARANQSLTNYTLSFSHFCHSLSSLALFHPLSQTCIEIVIHKDGSTRFVKGELSALCASSKDGDEEGFGDNIWEAERW